MSEISYFILLYFEEEVETRGDHIPENLISLGPCVNIDLLIFNNPRKLIGSLQQRVLTTEECNTAMYYILMNCEELKG
ncbi:hypothetical protein SLEP1_g55734 [Rubroshorea leprosula]|uniref:Uncharacterized protein n=1 Tax=Rubroshorea leprosula TaxID=152421 RepID=A0AAV5MHF7_9ROSI|nr:hypothetical protein SLEP1_g55734 [Rubroshorea leprosula]